jgi:hypothetical protein
MNEQMPFVVSERTRREDAEKAAKAAKGPGAKVAPVVEDTDHLEPGSLEFERAMMKRARPLFHDGKWLDGSAERSRALNEQRGSKFTAARGGRQ